MLDPGKVAEAYGNIASVNPPQHARASLEYLGLSLLRSVHPKQTEILNHRAAADPKWCDARDRIVSQHSLRASLYDHVLELDGHLRASPEAFVFPDPYSLLLWVWTFQVFADCLLPFGGNWRKYFYRGEARDYGATRFGPTIARPGADRVARDASAPARLRRLIRVRCGAESFIDTPDSTAALARYSIETISCAQALAVAQHYKYPTPLTDVTTNPEIAMWFATSGACGDDQIGILGSWGVGGDIEDLKALAVVVAPRAFSRIHLQSGYFFCAPRDRSSLNARATVLRFKRTAAVEPVVPTWTLLTGGRDPQSVDLLEDPFRMEAHLSVKLPRRISHRFPPPLEVNDSTLGMLKRAALESLFTGAGRHGITTDGRAYLEIKPGLVYCMVRFAPHQFLQYAMAAWIRHAAGERDLEQVVALLLTGLMLYLGIAPEIKPGEPARIPADSDVRRLIQQALEVIGESDLDRLDWPISAWYSPTATQTDSTINPA